MHVGRQIYVECNMMEISLRTHLENKWRFYNDYCWTIRRICWGLLDIGAGTQVHPEEKDCPSRCLV
jgi:hypothetical protein